MTKVLIFGTFDGIHQGHLNVFEQAKKYGDYLIVAVARDKNVLKIKNRLPQKNENERFEDLKKNSLINEVRLGYEDNPYKIIAEIKPDVICLGYDQLHFTEKLEDEVKKMGLKTKIYRLKAHKPKKYHSSILNK